MADKTMAFLQSHSIDAYGQPAAEVLGRLQQPMAQRAEQFAGNFYAMLGTDTQTAELLGRLGQEELARLRKRLTQHLIMLLHPDLTQPAHQAAAGRVGMVHALVGIDASWLTDAFSAYQGDCLNFLEAAVRVPRHRELLQRVVSQRIMFDLSCQMDSYRRLAVETMQAYLEIDQHVRASINLHDLVTGVLTTIAKLEGCAGAFFARADSQGQLQIEASVGAAAERYRQAMVSGEIPRISVDPKQPLGQGPGGRAWRSGQIVVSDSWALEADNSPWRAFGHALGFRSSAGVPLLDVSGRSIALLSLYSLWPGYFSTIRMKVFLGHVIDTVSRAVEQRLNAPVVPLVDQQKYRRLLDQQRVVMLYQPIVNLTDGMLAKVEALARLRDDDGSLLLPGSFLVAMGERDLLQLFEQGLTLACDDCLAWEIAGLRTQVSINFPAEGIGHPEYEEVLFGTLAMTGLAPDRLQIEMLETADGKGSSERRNAFIRKLQDAGLKIAQDDLGAGHSSLLRLDQYPFNEVKIDQGLVRGAVHQPWRALEFINDLTRLSHAFRMPVTVEGLENDGLIEAAMILGADLGQGYGIARPMPAADLMGWNQNRRWGYQRRTPHTVLGVMAWYLLWNMQLRWNDKGPGQVDRIVFDGGIFDHFLATKSLLGSDLDRLMRQDRELALTGCKGDAHRGIRDEVVTLLREYWDRTEAL